MVMDGLTRTVRRSGRNPLLREEWAGWSLWDWRSTSGPAVTDETALALTAVYRAVSLIAGTIGSMPVQVFEETINEDGSEGETRKLKTEDTAYLWRRPNDEMTTQTLVEALVADEVRGNGFIWVDKGPRGRIDGIWQIARSRMRVGRLPSGQKVYEMDGELPMIDYKDGGEIVHIPNWGNGLVGFDPIRVGREAIALGLSAQEYAARFFVNNGVPPGIITSEQVLQPEEAKSIADRWHKQYGGTRNAGKIAVLGGGSRFQEIQLDHEKAQLRELRGFQVTEYARLFGLPPHLLADVERSTSWGTGIEEQNRNLMTFTMAAHIRRIELAISDALLVRELTNRYMRFNIAALLRGTTLQQYQAFALGYGRWLTPNDIREILEMAPIDGGDVLPTASNLIPIEDLGTNFKEAPPPRGGEE